MRVEIEVMRGPSAGQVFRYDGRDRLIVGRAPDSHLCLAGDRYFSRHHLMIEIDPPDVRLVDLGSTNGTLLNGQRTAEGALVDGDELAGGDTVLRVRVKTGGTKPAKLRCGGCGAQAESERPREAGEGVAWRCPTCQTRARTQPTPLPGYRIVRELRRDNMGTTYLTVETATGAERALKVLVPRAPLSAERRAAFLRDAGAAAALRDDGIVRLYAVEEPQPGIFCALLENVDAAPGVGPLPIGDVLRVAAAAVDALTHAHAAGVVHGELTPARLLVLPGAIGVKIADFGLARPWEMSGASGFARRADGPGSIAFRAPERILHVRDAGPAADVYSLAAVLYQLLTGHVPHEPGKSGDHLLAVLEQPVVPLATRRPDVPAALAAAIERMLAREPKDRAGAAEDLRAASVA